MDAENKVESTVEAVKEGAGNAVESTKEAATDAVEGIKQGAEVAAEKAQELAGDAIEATKGLFGKIGEAINSVTEGAVNMAEKAVNKDLNKDGSIGGGEEEAN